MSIPNNRIDRSQSLSRQISAQTVPQMRDESHIEEPKSFAPKKPVQLNPPKDDPITPSELKKCDGSDETKPTLVAIKGTVFDVSHNKAYQPGGQYHVFAGKDPSRALAMSSLKEADAVPDWQDLEDKEKTVLDEWFTFFSKRYNVVGRVVDDGE
ncbi:putative progesterone binding [Phaeomoniella chlamydospora]|uniref:Putative progesterone binding n=1 Tax=Phaeomoniella chlamydospora TaxID=158046 RepID=A0A0G2ESG1_PHACM|nr:putative progesterone binding [Phaeomoniella chlamydospora]